MAAAMGTGEEDGHARKESSVKLYATPSPASVIPYKGAILEAGGLVRLWRGSQ